MLHSLQQEINTLLYIYFTSKGLLYLGSECDELLVELKNCVARINEILKEIEAVIQDEKDVQIVDFQDADAFLEWFSGS